MSLVETALLESADRAETQDLTPVPGHYEVESSGAIKQVPPGAIITIEPDGSFWLDAERLGFAEPLLNGDFVVKYEYNKAPAVLQFRQSGPNTEYMFGVSAAFAPAISAGALDDPPITGVWGAEARPPHNDYAV